MPGSGLGSGYIVVNEISITSTVEASSPMDKTGKINNHELWETENSGRENVG